ncbi:hypothetical protein ACI6Q2_12720 [Chitinophagaceae bacterium LWZ2-11]
MLNEYEAEFFIESKLPETKESADQEKPGININKAIRRLAQLMKKKFEADDTMSVKKCLHVAETLYNKGNNTVKVSIETIFIYSLSSIMPDERNARKQLQAIIPITLFSCYVKQIMHSGI